MNTVWLQFSEYDENNNCIVVDFEVSKEWLENRLEESLEDFLNEYTSDDSIPLYELAMLSGKILSENTSK